MNTDASVFHSIPQMLEALLAEILDITEQLSDVRESLKDAELEAMADAMEAKNGEGKALYSNDKAREIAAYRALKSDQSYQQDKATEKILERKK